MYTNIYTFFSLLFIVFKKLCHKEWVAGKMTKEYIVCLGEDISHSYSTIIGDVGLTTMPGQHM